MSSTKTHTGTLRILSRTTEDTINYIKSNGLDKYFQIYESNGRIHINKSDLAYEDECKYHLLNVKDQIYLVEFIKDHEFSEDEDLGMITKNSDDTFDFLIQYYNGGCCLDEALEYLLEENSI